MGCLLLFLISNKVSLNNPLEGIKILDLTRLLPGPLATQMMGDMGADIIKIEDYNSPDYTRFFPPQQNGTSIYFLALNRSKRSLGLNLRSETGKEIFFDLIKTADIVIESYRAGVIDKIGIGYEKAKSINPGIIYVSVTGYGQTGPYKDKAGHDLNYIGYSGILGLSGTKERPTIPATQIADIAGGSYPTVMACLAALLAKQKTGKGQHVDVAMSETILPMLSFPLSEYLNTGKNLKREEPMLSGGIANYNIYQCKDGKFMALGSLEPKFWKGFCQMIGKPDWVNRMMPTPQNISELKRDLEALFASKTQSEWISISANYDICLSPIYDLEEVHKDAHYNERNLFIEMESPHHGKLKGINQPIKFDSKGSQPKIPAPLHGEHSREILIEMGYSEEKITELSNKKIIKIVD